MEVKTDTKEKFHVIGVGSPHLSANMTEDFCSELLLYLKQNIKNIVLNLKAVTAIDEEAAECIVKTQQAFYDNHASFVICELQQQVEEMLDEKHLLEFLNTTRTESEAYDIVQMEEVERELFSDADEDENDELQP